MISINNLRSDSEQIIKALKVKNFDAKTIIMEVLELDENKRSTQTKMDAALSERNMLSKKIGELFKAGETEQANKLKLKTTEINKRSDELKVKFNELEEQLWDKLVQLPNIPHPSVPNGKNAEDNEEIFAKGEPPLLLTDKLPHWELASKFNLIDFELGVKITGAGFPVYKGKGAKLQRALINFFLDEAESAGYEEVIPPHMVNEDSAFGTGQLPDKEGQMYHVTGDNLYLIPTAEVPVTNIFRGEMLKHSELPLKYTAYSPCFRREAGSYGKDVRGLNRLHQFDKVEIVQIDHPDNSYETLNNMVEHVKGLLNKLELPYRILKLCGGDMSFTSALTFDFEVFSAAQERWLEVSSVSNFESYQANRLKLRFKDQDGKKKLAHTLNGSALALPRIMAAIMENYQYEGGIKIPTCLHPYLSFKEIN